MSVLACYTGTPSACYFATWEGFGGLPADIASAPTFSVPGRSYHLLTGSVEAVRELAAPFGAATGPCLVRRYRDRPQDHLHRC